MKILLKSSTWKLEEIFKLSKSEVCLHSLLRCKRQSKWSNSNVKIFYKCFLDEWKELKSCSRFLILTWIAYSDLRRNLENWLILKFVLIPCKTVKVRQDEQILIETWFITVFLMNGKELRSFSHFQILSWIAYSDVSRNLENWLIWSFSPLNGKLRKSVKMMKLECKHDLKVFSWWMEQN